VFGRATITLGIGPHSSCFYLLFYPSCLIRLVYYEIMILIINGRVCAGTDSETALRDAFIMFDEEKKGKLAEE